MAQIYVIGEDVLCCAIGERMVEQVLGWTLVLPAVNAKGVTKLQAALPRYSGLAKIHPVLCVADTDGVCPVAWLTRWMPRHAAQNFLLRLAVREAESWILADRAALAAFMGVPAARVSAQPDAVADPTREILHLASQSRKRLLRQEVVSPLDTSKAGNGYNLHLCEFVRKDWCPVRAAQSSPSLARAVRRLRALAL